MILRGRLVGVDARNVGDVKEHQFYTELVYFPHLGSGAKSDYDGFPIRIESPAGESWQLGRIVASRQSRDLVLDVHRRGYSPALVPPK